jgi:hypothetical protein
MRQLTALRAVDSVPNCGHNRGLLTNIVVELRLCPQLGTESLLTDGRPAAGRVRAFVCGSVAARAVG